MIPASSAAAASLRAVERAVFPLRDHSFDSDAAGGRAISDLAVVPAVVGTSPPLRGRALHGPATPLLSAVLSDSFESCLPLGAGPKVFVVDPDEASRQRVLEVSAAMNLEAEVFPRAEDFLRADIAQRPGCAVLEIRIPDLDGLQVQRLLSRGDCLLSVVFVAEPTDVSIAVAAMRAGAVHFVEKPPRDSEIWEAIQDAVRTSQGRYEAWWEDADCRRRTAELTEKEFDVLHLLAEGQSPRAIARNLDLSLRTVELRRSQMLKKLGLSSPVELMHFAWTHGELIREMHGPGRPVAQGVRSR